MRPHEGIQQNMRAIIAGDRNFTDRTVLDKVMEFAGTLAASNYLAWGVTEVVCGEASGVDTLGKEWALEHGIPVTSFPANWTEHGKAAGPIRNQQMGDYADMLIVIWNPAVSKGSANMFDYARKLGLPVVGYNYTQGSIHLFNINL
jgi:hypothetical protein